MLWDRTTQQFIQRLKRCRTSYTLFRVDKKKNIISTDWTIISLQRIVRVPLKKVYPSTISHTFLCDSSLTHSIATLTGFQVAHFTATYFYKYMHMYVNICIRVCMQIYLPTVSRNGNWNFTWDFIFLECPPVAE